MAYNNWFEQSPVQNPGFFQKTNWALHTFGRQQFAKSFASGGVASTIFAPTRKEMILSPWRSRVPIGSDQYVRNLRKLQALHKNDGGIKKALASVEKGSARGIGGSLLGLGLGAAFVAMPAFTTPGDISEKMRAVTAGIGSFGGFAVGSKVGMGIGAAVGSFIPVVGTAIGAGVGWLAGGLLGGAAGESLTDALTRIPDRMVANERKRRRSDWGMHTAAFQTQRAHTMRQQSLQMMNRGMMSARSLMGREAVFVHR